MWGCAGPATGVPWDAQPTMGTPPDPDMDPHVSPLPNGVRSRGQGPAAMGAPPPLLCRGTDTAEGFDCFYGYF